MLEWGAPGSRRASSGPHGKASGKDAAIDALSTFIPMDRRQALARGEPLPESTEGTALLADLGSLTTLTEAFTTALGAQQGVEELTRLLNRIYDPLVAAVHTYGGSVLGFSGDALTAWFDGDSGLRAATCALAMQQAVRPFSPLRLPGGSTASLAFRCIIAAGPAHRFHAGDAAIRYLDVLAGLALERLGAVEAFTASGEIVLDATAGGALDTAGAQGTWRSDPEDGTRYLALAALDRPAAPTPWPLLPPGALPDAALRPWVLPAVWERLGPEREAFLAELRPAVILFLRFGGIDYTRPVAGTRLDAYIRWVQEVLARYGGSLLGVTIGARGSSFYGTFGVPVAHADSAARAAAAALTLRSPPPDYNFIRRVQIGLSGGRVWAGAYGGSAARVYGVLGNAVNLAARLMEYATPGGILVTRDVEAAAGPRFRWASLPPLQVAGKATPVAVAGLIDETATLEHRLLEPLHRGPLVGRAPELALLATKWRMVGAGQGQILGVTGEAGLGKSRLLAEMVERVRSAGGVAYLGAAQSYGTGSPYLAWQPVWQAFFDQDPDGLPDELVAALEEALAAIHPALLERLPLLGAVLGLAIPDTPLTAGFDPALRKSSLEALLADCLHARAREGPLLVVLEDCQWLDPLSVDLLDAVGRAIPGLPVLLLLAYRPPEPGAAGVAARVGALPHFTELTLAGLTPAEAAELVAARLAREAAAGPALPADLVAGLTTRAAGNPFYLEELLNYVVAGGSALGEAVGGDPAGARVAWPTSLQSLLLARIDRLPERQRTILKIASIIGRQFRVRQLWGVYPDLGPPGEVDADLALLARLDWTVPDPTIAEPAYQFKHIITQEVTYATLTGALRTQLHARFAGWLEGQAAMAGTPPPLDLLAYHYGRSTHLAKQREYYRRAGDAAAAGYANAAAADYYRALLNLLPPADRGDVLLALGAVLEQGGAWDAAAACYEDAWTTGDAARRPALCGWAAQGLGLVRRNQGNYPAAATWLEQARGAFGAAADPEGMSRVLADLGQLYELQGDYRRARGVLEESLASCRAHADAPWATPGLALALLALGTVAYRQGDFARARALGEESLALRRAHADKPGIATALSLLSTIAVDQGDLTAARVLVEEGLALRREIGDKQGIATFLNRLGNVADEQGDLATARACYEESLALFRELGDQRGIAGALNNLGLVTAVEADYAAARACYEESLVLKRALGDKRGIALTLLNLGEVAIYQGDYPSARALTTESLELSRELDARPGIGWALANLGLVAWYAGDHQEAEAFWKEGLAIFAELGARRDVAYGLVGLAGVAVDAGETARAGRLLGAAAQLLANQATALQPLERRIYEHTEMRARRGLGDTAFAAAFAAGAALSWDAALAEALAPAAPLLP